MSSFSNNCLLKISFSPDDPSKISRKKRMVLAATALILAPNQPESRPFEYIGFGSGALRQDLHQVLSLLTANKTNNFSPINKMRISLIDPLYTDQNVLKEYLVDFAAAISLLAPQSSLEIDVFASTEEYFQLREANPPIDFLVGVRVEYHDKAVKSDIDRLSKQLSDDSGFLVSDTTQQNNAITSCKRNNKSVQMPDLLNTELKAKNLVRYTIAL